MISTMLCSALHLPDVFCVSQAYLKDSRFHIAFFHVWKARVHCLESEKATLKSLAPILTGKAPTQLKEVVEFFVRLLVGAKLLEMASAMTRIFFFNGSQSNFIDRGGTPLAVATRTDIFLGYIK